MQNESIMLITTNVMKKMPVFLNESFAREAVEHLYRVRDMYLFSLYGFVIMPDHCHFLVLVPKPGSISTIMRVYKMGLTFCIGEGPLWQSRFHVVIPNNPCAALHYIHMNPVKKGLVESPEDYAWSSAHRNWSVEDLPC